MIFLKSIQTLKLFKTGKESQKERKCFAGRLPGTDRTQIPAEVKRKTFSNIEAFLFVREAGVDKKGYVETSNGS